MTLVALIVLIALVTTVAFLGTSWVAQWLTELGVVLSVLAIVGGIWLSRLLLIGAAVVDPTSITTVCAILAIGAGLLSGSIRHLKLLCRFSRESLIANRS